MPVVESSSAAAAPAPADLRPSGFLDPVNTAAFDRLVRLAGRLLRAPAGVVSLVDGQRLLFKGAAGLPEPWAAGREMPFSQTLCRLVIETAAPLVVPDTRMEPRARECPAVTELGIAAYLGVPLGFPGEAPLGAFCVIDSQPRAWSPADVELLQELAPSVLTELRLGEVTERVAAQAQVAAREREQFAQLVNDLEAVVWEADARTWRFTFVSRRAEALLGYPVERWLEEEGFWAGIIHPEDRERAIRTCSRATAAGQDHEFEYRALAADGRVVWLKDLVRVIPGEDGAPARLRGLMLDVTAQKHTQEQVRHVVSSALCLLWEARIEQREEGLYWEHHVPDEAAAQRFLPLELAPGQTYARAWKESRLAEDLPRIRAQSEAACLGGHPRYTHEYRCRRRDGEVRWLFEDVRVERDGPGRWRAVGVCSDITERMRSEAALAARERWFRSLIEKSSDVISILDADGTIRYASPSLERILGYRPEEVVDTVAFSLIHPADREQVVARFRAVAADPEIPPLVLPYRLRRADGSWRWFESTATNLLHDPVVQGIVVNSHDVSERQDRETHLRYVSKHANCILWLGDVQEIGKEELAWSLQLVDAETAQRVLPLDVGPGEHYFRAWYRSRLDPDREESDRYGNGEVRAGRSYSQEFRCRDAEGRVRWIHEDVQIETVAPGRWRAVGVAMDTTARRRALERARTFHVLGEQLNLAATPREAARIVVDAADRLLGWDCCWVELVDAELRAGTMVLGMDLINGVRQEVPQTAGRGGVSPLAARAIREGGILTLRKPETLPDPTSPEHLFFGDLHRASASRLCVPIHSGARPIGALSIQSYAFNAYGPEDVSTLQALADYCAGALERTQAEAARRDLQQQLLQAQKMEAVGRLAGGVAHDFNNMLAVINGYSELCLGRAETPDALREPLAEIRLAGQRAAALTRRLLAFSRKQFIQPELLDLAEVVTRFRQMLHPLIGEDILLRIETQAGCRIKADRVQIEQVLMNLAVNARDAMPRGGNLLIRVEPEEIDRQFAPGGEAVPPGSYVLLTVSDTGCGMDADTLQHLFEPFFTTKPAGQGTGLGLATVYGIVEQNRGQIRVASEPGRGTTFRIYLPRLAEFLSGSSPEQDVRNGEGSETVLLVEDEAMLRRLMCSVLRTHGYQVLEAASADAALRLCQEHSGRIDLLVTDVVMPGRSGRELAVFARSRYPELEVIYMSGYTDDAVVRHGVRAAEVPFLQKPFSPMDLLRTIRSVLDAGETP